MQITLRPDDLVEILLRHFNIPKQKANTVAFDIGFWPKNQVRLLDQQILCEHLPSDSQRAKGIEYLDIQYATLTLTPFASQQTVKGVDVETHLEIEKRVPFTVNEATHQEVRDALPPHSQEAEQAVLGAILANHQETKSILEGLPSAFLYRPAHKRIFVAMKRLLAAGEEPDTINVSEFLQSHGQLEDVGGRYYLGLLLSHAPMANQAQKYADIIKEKAKARYQKDSFRFRTDDTGTYFTDDDGAVEPIK